MDIINHVCTEYMRIKCKLPPSTEEGGDTFGMLSATVHFSHVVWMKPGADHLEKKEAGVKHVRSRQYKVIVLCNIVFNIGDIKIENFISDAYLSNSKFRPARLDLRMRFSSFFFVPARICREYGACSSLLNAILAH